MILDFYHETENKTVLHPLTLNQRIEPNPRGFKMPPIESSYWISVLDELNYAFQPIVNIHTGVCYGVDVFKTLAPRHKGLHLVMVGDGPYRTDMQQALAGTPCTFTGYLEGEEDLAAAYASCDVFVFPSNTDTFGNVVLEAQASGIPVIVSSQGGPKENMSPGQTGLVVVEDSVAAWVEAVDALVTQPDRRLRMGQAGRKLMEARSFDAAFIQSWKMYQNNGEEEAPGSVVV